MKNNGDKFQYNSLIGVVNNLVDSVKLLTADNERLEEENCRLSSYNRLLDEQIEDLKNRLAALQETGISNETAAQAAD